MYDNYYDGNAKFIFISQQHALGVLTATRFPLRTFVRNGQYVPARVARARPLRIVSGQLAKQREQEEPFALPHGSLARRT